MFYLDGSQGELPTEPRIPTPCPRTDSVPLCFDALAETDDLLSASTRRIALRAGLAPNAVVCAVHRLEAQFFVQTRHVISQLSATVPTPRSPWRWWRRMSFSATRHWHCSNSQTRYAHGDYFAARWPALL